MASFQFLPRAGRPRAQHADEVEGRLRLRRGEIQLLLPWDKGILGI